MGNLPRRLLIMAIKPGKPIKLSGAVLTRLDEIRNHADSYSESVSKLIDIAEARDSRPGGK